MDIVEDVPEPMAQEEEDLEVESILDTRRVSGKVQYLLKWKGFSEEHNSWEPEENLACPDLIEAFESKRRSRKKDEEKKRRSKEVRSTKLSGEEDANTPPSKKKKGNKTDKDDTIKEEDKVIEKLTSSKKLDTPRGFDRGLEAERILGATNSMGPLMFLMKWKGSQEADLVPAKQANIACPQVVIKFYEDRLSWHSTTDPTESL